MALWGGLTNNCEKKRGENKGEKERYKHLSAEFQRIARRDKKVFLSDQRKEIEENIRMGKTRDLFKKIRDTKGTFHAKMGSIKDSNGMDLTEAEDIKKRWQEYTEELYKKDRHNPDNHGGLITQEVFISPCYSLELCIQIVIAFLFSFAFHFSSFHSYL